MKTLISTLLLIISLTSTLFSQPLIFEGGEVTMKDGTIKSGYLIKDTKWKMEKGITFKPELAADEVFYSVDDITSFRFTEANEEYRLVEIDIRKGKGNVEKWEKKQKFSRVLIDGDITLIRAFLNKSEYDSRVVGSQGYMYILFKDGEKHQIDQQDPVLIGKVWQVSYSFRPKLRHIFQGCQAAEEHIMKMEFQDSEFLALIRAYEGCRDIEANYFTIKASPNAIYNHQVGASFLIIDAEGYNSPASLSAAYGGEFRFPGLSRKLGFSLTGEVVFYNYRYTSNFVSHIFAKQKILVNHYFYETPDFAFQLGGGFDWQFPLTSLNEGPGPLSITLFDLTAKMRFKKTTFSISAENSLGPGRIISFYILQQIGSSRLGIK
ncbi:MAG: hypothetical protein KDE26_29420 [Bacteroidetes bacterium]|nr:hypothetical protein [Bacteroidota bacterium]